MKYTRDVKKSINSFLHKKVFVHYITGMKDGYGNGIV